MADLKIGAGLKSPTIQLETPETRGPRCEPDLRVAKMVSTDPIIVCAPCRCGDRDHLFTHTTYPSEMTYLGDRAYV